MRTAALVLGALAWLAAPAAAQGYPRVHIVALSQRADRTTVEPDGTFHVTIHVAIAQRRERLDELILGTFGNCEIISNETVRTALPNGTDFVERLTVQALAPGEATISPAYIDAIDPALGKPMRYSSNALRVQVVANGAPLRAPLEHLGALARRAAMVGAIVVGLVAAAFVLGVLFVRRRRRPAVAAAVPPPPAAPAPPRPGDDLPRATQTYRQERSAAALAQVRALLYDAAGVARGATLTDALRALGERDPQLRAALHAADDAAFGPAFGRAAAGERMLAALDAYLGSSGRVGSR